MNRQLEPGWEGTWTSKMAKIMDPTLPIRGCKVQAKDLRGPKDHISIRILHSGSKAQDKADSRNRGLSDPHVYVVVGALM